MTYVVGGSLVDVLAPAMKTENWQNVSANVIKIVGNSFLDAYTSSILSQLFDGNYVPGDVIGFSVKNLDKAYNKGYNTFGGNWGFAVGALNAAAGLSILQLVVFQENAMQLSNVNWLGLICFAAALFILRKWKWNPILVMALCGVCGLIAALL